ncbi:glycosyltransferase family 2 protein [Patescibacteria group bacterium]|nr:glycosyltransferase family 2 protein [Patescibacteria group bacterium]
MTKIDIVILHFNNQKLTDNCLESVKKLAVLDFKLETIIVNNNPQEEIDSLKKKYPEFIFLETKKNMGFTGGNNLGIKKALENKADFVFLLNNDTLLDKNLLGELLKALKTDKKIGILSPKIYFAPGYEFHKGRYLKKDQGKVIWYAGGLLDWQNIIASHQGVDEVDHGQYNQIIPVDFTSGCGMLVKKEVFGKVGFFDERYFLYWEDVDFCQRAKRAAYKIIFVPSAKVWHANAGSSEVGGKLHDYYMTRNRMFFAFKYTSLKMKFALIRESLKILFKGSPWQKLGIRDFYLRRFGQAGFKL